MLAGFRHLADDLAVFGVRADPDPVDSLFDFRPQGSIMIANADGPKLADALEMQGRMTRVRFEESEILVGQGANFPGQRLIQRPEARRG